MANQWINAVSSVKAKIKGAVQASFVELGANIIVGTPVDAGTLVNNWVGAIGSVDYSNDNDADASGTKSTISLNVAADQLDEGKVMYFTNSMPYAHRIEYDGHSEKAKAGMVRVNVAQWDNIVKRNIRAYS